MGNVECCEQTNRDYQYKYTQSFKNSLNQKNKEPQSSSRYQLPNQSKYDKESKFFQEKLQEVHISKTHQQNKAPNSQLYSKDQELYRPSKTLQSLANPKDEEHQHIKFQESRYSIINALAPKQFQKFGKKEREMQIQVFETKQTEVKVPSLSRNIEKRLNQEKFYQDKFDQKVQLRNFGGQIYQGYLNSQNKRPHGYGKMYKSDGSLFIGQFTNGVANGESVIIFEDGSYLKGLFAENTANGIGHFQADQFKYTGNFKNNLFHGKQGKEIGPNYQFNGEYIQGRKILGKLKWKNESTEYFYNGMFNENNQFHGLGQLIQPEGQYTGYFNNGKRQGKGEYKFTNGLIYKGQYLKNLKHGKGTVYNVDNSIAYQGQFNNGLPHGQGYISEEGKLIQKNWVYGVDSALL